MAQETFASKISQSLNRVSSRNGICGSDVHIFQVPFVKVPTATTPDPLTGETLPITMGHEFSGTVVELGEGADGNKFPVGQNVIVEPIFSCMKASCGACTAGTRNLCPLVNCIGIGGFGGGLAEYITVDELLVHRLPDGIPLDIGAMLEPLAVSWHCVKRSEFKPNDTVLISGAGPIGLFLLKVLRRELAQEHGATLVVDPLSTDVVNATMKATDGLGVHIAFDAAGIQATMTAAVQSVRARGKVVNVASWEKPPQIDLNLCLLKEITILSSNTYTGDHPDMLEAVAAGRFAGLEGLITGKVALDDVVEKGFNALINDKDSHVKILIHP
ncbi:alcohol dehydrogenase GroES domain protein [Leucogyrophana mollusca]|uniref:Alcohol dehydrogenase GroES domain protein n=1 Tax=Leucogyrophana mollusca TaxID=85980 RepID=A0ACB8BQT3_9AGAM|nr:alcohol dehydrogenase GroES domain protein [Leucogyrophana mollusca]